MRKRNVLVLLLLVSLTTYVFISRGYIGSLVHPLPFEGPYNGTIIDDFSGNPVENARVMANWWCYDSPDPHFGNYWVHVSVTSDENGRYEIKKPYRRAGWFGGSFTLSVNAKGYVPVVAVMPDEPPLPPSTKAYPFRDTRAYASFPESMDIRLKPFKPVLLEALKSENAQYRWMAADELGKIGKDATYAVEPLIQRLKDRDATVRKYSADALGKIRYDGKDAVLALIATLNDEDKWVRLAAIDALGSIGSAHDGVISALIKLLTDNDDSVRTHAVRSLTKFGPKATSAVPILKDLLARRWISKYFRSDIEYALKNIDPNTLYETSTQ
jgi:hypothetical protein